MSTSRASYLSFLAVFLWVVLVSSGPLAAQSTFEPVVELDFADPESWAMQYFASASVMTSLGPVEPSEPGELRLGFEAMWVPELDREQRTVGFGGFKEEDLNRSAVWGRLRLDVGLPGRFTATIGWIPPVELDGVDASLVSLALGRPLVTRDAWGLGLRLIGQTGEVKGDLTCKEGAEHLFPSGSPENPFGCEAPSSDEVTLDYWGAQLVSHHRLQAGAGPVLHFGVSWHRMDLDFQVEALTFGFLDRSLLRAEGDTWALTAGARWDLGERSTLAVEGFYSDLDVERPGRDRESDPFWNLRIGFGYRIR